MLGLDIDNLEQITDEKLVDNLFAEKNRKIQELEEKFAESEFLHK